MPYAGAGMAVHGPLKLRRSALVAAALAAGLATPSPASATGPGRNGAFVFGGVGQLVKVMPGSPPVNITPDNDEDDYFDVAVSFDGQRIAATKSGDGNRMITSRLDRSDLHEFTAGRFPSFLPDGRVISDDQTPNYESEIYATAPDGSGRVRLSYDSDPGYFKYNPVASPDGRSVYFYDSGRAVNSDGYRIRKVDLATGAVSLVLSSGQTSAIALADVSPDGRHLLLTRFRGAAAPYDLVVRSLQDGSEKVVTQAAAYGDAVFSPDGTTVAYITANGLDIRGVGLDGDNDRLLFALRESDEDGFVKMNNLNWQPIVASDLVVNRTGDEEDDDTDDGVCDVDPAVAGLQCTLRAAIQEANASAASALVPAKIRFELEAGATPTISPGSPLPALEKPVQLDGRTGATKVRLDGAAAGSTASGLRLQGGTSLVHDLAVTRFARDGIVIDGGSGTVIGDSDLGALPDGSCGDPCALGNGRSGVRITGGAVKSRVGDPMALNSTERVQASLDAIRNDTYFPSQNVIAHNGDDAVTIISGRENDVAGNRMYANADLAIDLLGDGISANDPRDLDTGPNDLINAPAATSSSARPISGQSRYQRVGQALYVGTPDRPLRLVSYALDGCDAPFSEQADRIGSDGDFLTDAVGRSEPTGTADRSALPEASTSLAFAVVDRQGNTSEVSNCSIDEDGDAIDDGFEREGADLDRDGTAEVPLDRLGAVVGKHDVFVEVDWTRGHALDREALERVQQAYAGSPHLNPDGSTGVRLHIDNWPGLAAPGRRQLGRAGARERGQDAPRIPAGRRRGWPLGELRRSQGSRVRCRQTSVLPLRAVGAPARCGRPRDARRGPRRIRHAGWGDFRDRYGARAGCVLRTRGHRLPGSRGCAGRRLHARARPPVGPQARRHRRAAAQAELLLGHELPLRHRHPAPERVA